VNAEGMEQALMVTRLGVTGALKRKLRSTNPIESMLASVRHTQRNVKRWRDGDMPALDRRRKRRSPAQLPPCQGRRDLPKLAAAIRREPDPAPTKEASPPSSPP
jgi:hypothetical protein